MPHWTRREFLKASGIGLAAAALPRRAQATMPPRPNVVLVLADQWRASATGYAGDANVKTPNLDRLARESVNFTNAVSCCPVCTPYRAALLTGRYPTTTGMFLNDLYLPDDALCMAEMFKGAGYDTAYIGKWHVDGHGRRSYIPPERRQGFDYWKAAECDHNYPKSHYYSGRSPEMKFWQGYDAFAQAHDAQAYIRDHAGGKRPFLLALSFGAPHFPHQAAPEDCKAIYPEERLILAPNIPERQRPAVLKELPGYYGHCTALDKCIGEIIRTLGEAGIAGNTIFVFTSDHGEMMGGHDLKPTTKQHPWDESVHIPFLLRFPAVHGAAGKTVSTPINTPDILPTLLGLAGLAMPPTIEGEDLSSLVQIGADERDRSVLIMSVSPFIPALREYRGIRTNRYTYVRDLHGPWLLFDNRTDPYQMDNLVGKPGAAELQARCDAILGAELRRSGDDFRPGRFYIEKWGYQVAQGGAISYEPGAPPQGPGIRTPRSPLPAWTASPPGE
jgi:arylsulfatase A-like enzyme